MATIALSANKINQMPTMIKQVKESVENYKSELFAIKKQMLSISPSTCDLSDTIISIQASTQTQEDKINSLDKLECESEEFISEVVQIDEEVADIINQRKDEFYEAYYYLKPECEKSWTDKAKDAVASATEWCREHWKAIATLILVAAAVLVIVFTAGTALTVMTALLVAVAKGVLIGTVIGGLAGGIASALAGGSFLEGVENGAFGGAVSGAVSGGLGHILSLGGAAVSMKELMFIGASSEFTSSLFGDLGDIMIKNSDMSTGEVMFNALFSGLIGAAAAGAGYWLSEKFTIRIFKINKGIGSWKHVWASQSTKSLRYASKISLKTLLKGIGSEALDGAWNHLIDVFKSLIGEWKDSWNSNRKNANSWEMAYGD